MLEPLDEAVLVDVFDGAGAEARVEEGLVDGPFAPTNSTNFRTCKQDIVRWLNYKWLWVYCEDVQLGSLTDY